MERQARKLVTGALGYIGYYVTRILTGRGEKVKTLTGHTGRSNPFGDMVEAAPYHFDEPAKLVEDLRGIETVFNTYWVRFNHGATTYGGAVANTQNLIRAAREAGVKRFVHVSITRPSLESPYDYFRGKAVMEETLKRSGLSWAIVRPTVVFGREDILINNISWMLRRFPVFGIFGRGDYRMQPVYVEDLARLMVELGDVETETTVDAVGPETYAYADLVRLMRRELRSKSRLVSIPPLLGFLAGRVLGPVLGDVLITKDEIDGLMDGLLVSEHPPTCPARFSEWFHEHAKEMGAGYANELDRHFR